MIARDLLELAASNLSRLRLRTFLTTAGVVIAVGAMVSMLSFGAGNQRLIQDEYDKFGLLFTMQVYPKENPPDSVPSAVLNDSALLHLQKLPGVRLAYPLEAVSVECAWRDTTVTTRAQGLSAIALSTGLYSSLAAGRQFQSDSASEVIVTSRFLEHFGKISPDSVVGSKFTVTTRLSRLDSAMVNVFTDPDGEIRRRVAGLRLDSLRSRAFRERAVRDEASAAFNRFLVGLTQHRATVTETLTIVGVIESVQQSRRRHEEILVPVRTVRRLTAGGVSENPADLFVMLSRGRIPWGDLETESKVYDRVTLDLDPEVPYKGVADSVKALGFDTFSYAEQFDELREAFLYIDLALGAIGFVALVTASLGIANTLFMATLERRREIGILQALGAGRGDIRLLFLVESAVIGAAGAVGGLILGWGVSRLGAFVSQKIMERHGATPVDMFMVTWWLIVLALALGVLVSVLAGYLPSNKAARVDPVEALRAD